MTFTMPDLGSAIFWVALGKIMIANIILSGDNAVVIAMACRNLEKKYQRPAIMFGSAGAIVLRIVFCAVIGFLLGVPFLKLIGGLLLFWIGIKLVAEEEEGGDNIKAHGTLWAAIWTIVVADAVMSLDNAIAIAAAAKGDFTLIIIGLVISIPIIVLGATMITKLIERFPVLVLIGGGLIGWIAGEVIATDSKLEPWFKATIPHHEYTLAAIGVVVVLAAGKFVAMRHKATADAAAKH